MITDRASCGTSLLNAADLHLYAAKTVSELLHIYGLPDDSEAAATDLRNQGPSSGNCSRATTPVSSVRVDLPPAEHDAAGSPEQLATSLSSTLPPGVVIRQLKGHPNELSHVKGMPDR